jgi:hypothetical protein
MNKPFLKAMLIIVVLELLCLLGSGCCTAGVRSVWLDGLDHHQIMVKECELSDDGKRFVIDVVEFVYPGGKLCQFRKEYPLDRCPKSMKKFEMDVTVDEKAERMTLDQFNFGYKRENGRFVTENHRLVLDDVVPYMIPRHEMPDGVNIEKLNTIEVRVHPDDLHYLSKPFIIKCSYNLYKKGQLMYVFSGDLPYESFFVMYPYKIDGKHYSLYTDAKMNEYLHGQGIHEYRFTPNAGSYLAMALLLPPAVVIDVVTLPIQAAVFYYICLSMKKLGP